MATQQATTRLQKELKSLLKEPLPGLRALPHPQNLLEWHYVLEGASDSEYAGGFYHGKIVFPPQYPFKPPSIMMLTPSGRFEAGSKICLSLSDFHPESWNPLWGVSHILLGLQSFFYENTSTTGALQGVSPSEKRRLAWQSLTYNMRNVLFRQLFPELVEKHAEQQAAAAAAAAAKSGDSLCGGGPAKDGGPMQGGGGHEGLPIKWPEIAFGVAVALVGVGLAAFVAGNSNLLL